MMKHVLLILSLMLTACASGEPQSTGDPSLSDLECGAERCSASIEQHPGKFPWYIVIRPADCGVVQTADGKKLGICGGERLIGNADIDLKSGSCRVCKRKPR